MAVPDTNKNSFATRRSWLGAISIEVAVMARNSMYIVNGICASEDATHSHLHCLT